MKKVTVSITYDICKYIIKPKYVMLEWIKEIYKKFSVIDIDRICNNPNGMDWIEDNVKAGLKLTRTNWKYISSNPNAIPFIKKYGKNNIDWKYLSSNPNAYDIIINNIDKIDWNMLSSNPLLINILNKFPELETNINYDNLCSNTNPKAIKLLLKKPELINWVATSSLKLNISCINYIVFHYFIIFNLL